MTPQPDKAALDAARNAAKRWNNHSFEDDCGNDGQTMADFILSIPDPAPVVRADDDNNAAIREMDAFANGFNAAKPTNTHCAVCDREIEAGYDNKDTLALVHKCCAFKLEVGRVVRADALDDGIKRPVRVKLKEGSNWPCWRVVEDAGAGSTIAYCVGNKDANAIAAALNAAPAQSPAPGSYRVQTNNLGCAYIEDATGTPLSMATVAAIMNGRGGEKADRFAGGRWECAAPHVLTIDPDRQYYFRGNQQYWRFPARADSRRNCPWDGGLFEVFCGADGQPLPVEMPPAGPAGGEG